MRRILIRADGNAKIGLGHIIRCLALAEMLKDTFRIEFATTSKDITVRKKILDVCHRIIDLNETKSHFDSFIELTESKDIVVLDNYFFTSEYQKKIKSKGCKLVCISDAPDKYFWADLVINSLPGSEKFQYSHAKYTKLLLGSSYLLLRKQFLHRPIQTRYLKNKPDKIMICFGGSDPLNLTNKILHNINQLNITPLVIVVLGEANLNKGIIIKTSNIVNFKIELYQNLTAYELQQLMLKSDLGIFPSSGILLEALSQNLPCITGYYTKNQIENYSEIINKKLAIGIGNISNNTLKNQHLNISGINLNELHGFIDGQSPVRLLKAFEELNQSILKPL